MRIVSLQAENIKRLTAIEIKPDGALVQITGRNGAGKTSVLDSIWWALSGAKNIQVSPIRAGAQKAHIRLDLGELVVTRKFSRKDDDTFTTTITVENADGARFRSPQEVLDKLVGALSFDPLAFTRLAPKEQLETLKGLVPGVDWASIEEANDKDFKARTDINRRAGELRARANAIVVPDGTPTEPIDSEALIASLDDAGKRNADIERARHDRVRSQDAIDKTLDGVKADLAEIDALQAKIATLQQSVEGGRILAMQLKEELDGMEPVPDPIDTAEIRRKINEANAVNTAVGLGFNKRKLEADALAAEVQAGHLTKAIRDRGEQVANAIANAQLPVPGLGFGNGHVVLNGQPFDQASDAEQLRTSIALAMSMNPTLRVLRIRDGSLLDEQGLQLVAEMADDRDFQVWVERVDSTGRVGVVIEDGAVREAIAEAAE